jgi:hypothetical protein
MSKVIIWTDSETGGAVVLVPGDLRPGYTTEAATIARAIEKSAPEGVEHFIIEKASVAQTTGDDTRYYRNAWVVVAGELKVDMPKARVIHMDKIRRVRNAELVKEDVTFMRAVEAGDASAQSTVATKKQVLRDIPATFDITTDVDTPEKLKAKWPTELPARE